MLKSKSAFKDKDIEMMAQSLNKLPLIAHILNKLTIIYSKAVTLAEESPIALLYSLLIQFKAILKCKLLGRNGHYGGRFTYLHNLLRSVQNLQMLGHKSINFCSIKTENDS